ncbi:hypothetical protein AHAS_Ahas19G0156300 [Arachis hypogaea]
MPLHERIIFYLQAVELYYIARVYEYRFKFDETFICAFIKQSHIKRHIFYMLFEECIMIL